MNREIKFRGRTPEGKWIYGDLLRVAGGTLIYYGSPVEAETCELEGVGVALMSNEIAVVVPETVGQFTGLRDRNGEDIYEGDILHIGRSKKSKPVAYSNEYAAFGIQYPDRDFFPFAHDLQDISETCYEVIGNIHDNPELMKGGAK